jgi:hypothetical protein
MVTDGYGCTPICMGAPNVGMGAPNVAMGAPIGMPYVGCCCTQIALIFARWLQHGMEVFVKCRKRGMRATLIDSTGNITANFEWQLKKQSDCCVCVSLQGWGHICTAETLQITHPKRHACDPPYPRDTNAQQKHCIYNIQRDIHAIPRRVIRIHRGLRQDRASPQPLPLRQSSRAPQSVGRASTLFYFPLPACPLVRLNRHTT